jgi:anthranilate/para-aminobenzoate synthase component I
VIRKVLADSETPVSAYRKLADNRPGTFLLESAENGRSWSRWSFIGAGAPSALTVRTAKRRGWAAPHRAHRPAVTPAGAA